MSVSIPRITISLAQLRVLPSVTQMIEMGHAYAAEAKRRGSDLILFPEMWTTGFRWEEIKKLPDSLNEISAIAKTHQIWVGGSSPFEGRNRFTLFSPDGELAAKYDKTHLFSLMNEDKHIKPGDHLTLYEAPWGKTGLAVCYDIRFPELFRTYAVQGARLILLPVAFPHPRRDHLMTLLKARAIENQAFMVMSNRVGSEEFDDAPEAHYFGSSTIIDPWGRTEVLAGEEEETLITAEINLSKATNVREKMNVLSDRRPELYF